MSRFRSFGAIVLALSMSWAGERSIAIQDPNTGGPVPAAWAVDPVLDAPLGAPSICRLPDGRFLLTGTQAPGDATGLRLWCSTDLVHWQALGQVWASTRAIASPKPQVIDGTLYITYHLSGTGCGILKGSAADPAATYADLGCVLPEARSLSLFRDDDGGVYAVWDEGWFARLRPDLGGLAGRPRLVRPSPQSDLGNSPFTVGRGGAQLFKHEGRYYLNAWEWTGRTGFPVMDSYVCGATSLDGPWDIRVLMLAHGGESTVFQDGGGNWFATVGDPSERCRLGGRPGIAPLVWRTGEWYNPKGPKLPYPWKPQHIITERGPWEQCRPITDYHLRDISVLVHDDGYLYFTGSCTDKRLSFKVMLFRFRISDAARVGRGEGLIEQHVVMEHKDIPWLDLDNRLKLGAGRNGSLGLLTQTMDTKVSHVGGTFYLTCNLYTGGSLDKNPTLDGGTTFTKGSPLFRSTSGRWDGPWTCIGRAPYPHCQLHEDEQGRIVTQAGWKGIFQLQPDGSFTVLRKAEELPQVTYPADGTAFCDDGAGLGHVGFSELFRRHAWHSTEWNGPSSLDIEMRPSGTYDISFAFSESGTSAGPYPRCRNTLPHCGGAAQFKDDRGRYWSTFFGNEMTAPWYCRLGIIPLDVRIDGNQHLVDIADAWPAD